MDGLSNIPFVGVGIYTVPEAARLTRVSSTRIHGWIKGYRGSDKPLIHRQIPVIDGKANLGFLDLMEVKFVNAFVSQGVSWKTIRLAAQRARSQFNHEHPFSTHRFRTDGRTIFSETLEETGDSKLLDLVKNQFAMYRVIEKSLLEGVEFDGAGEAIRWRPMSDLDMVVVDPRRSFGRPILEATGVPTRVLYEAFTVEGDAKRVASWYEVTPEEVRQAVEFEVKLAA